MSRWYAYLASVEDSVRIGLQLEDTHHQLPPPGLELRLGSDVIPRDYPPWPFGAFRTPIYVEVPEGLPPIEGWWWSTVGDAIANLNQAEKAILVAYIAKLSPVIGADVAALLNAIIVIKGRREQTMRWIQSTFRGLLFGEAFQHKLDWGIPGADPTTPEADALTLADDMATAWSTTMAASLLVAFSPDVVYTEVGVVELNQDDAGGDVTESYGTQWSMYPTGSRPAGGSATTSLPYEVSCCVSLQTDHRGPSGKGRFYLPPMSKDAITVHGLHNMGVVSPVIVAIGNYIDNIKASTPLLPIVVSRTKKILNEVTSINCGVVPDSQRRRRRSLSEARVAEWSA